MKHDQTARDLEISRSARPGQDGFGNAYAERPSGFQVNNKLEHRRLFDWQVCRLHALQYLVHIVRRTLVQRGTRGAIREQRTCFRSSALGLPLSPRRPRPGERLGAHDLV